MHSILIEVGDISIKAELNGSKTSNLILDELPLNATVNLWGDEIYFDTGVNAALAPDSSDLVTSGDLAYWPPGAALCIFYGPTPASIGDEIRAASAVNIIGTVKGDESIFREVENGSTISVSRISGE